MLLKNIRDKAESKYIPIRYLQFDNIKSDIKIIINMIILYFILNMK